MPSPRNPLGIGPWLLLAALLPGALVSAATVATPPLAPVTSTWSPRRSSPQRCSPRYAVPKVQCITAASAAGSSSGTLKKHRWGARMRVA